MKLPDYEEILSFRETTDSLVLLTDKTSSICLIHLFLFNVSWAALSSLEGHVGLWCADVWPTVRDTWCKCPEGTVLCVSDTNVDVTQRQKKLITRGNVHEQDKEAKCALDCEDFRCWSSELQMKQLIGNHWNKEFPAREASAQMTAG